MAPLLFFTDDPDAHGWETINPNPKYSPEMGKAGIVRDVLWRAYSEAIDDGEHRAIIEHMATQAGQADDVIEAIWNAENKP